MKFFLYIKNWRWPGVSLLHWALALVMIWLWWKVFFKFCSSAFLHLKGKVIIDLWKLNLVSESCSEKKIRVKLV